MYAHARLWAPSLNVPFAVPTLRFTKVENRPCGSFSVSSHGVTVIEIDRSLRKMPMALGRVLAHEACHHILEQAGFSDRNDDRVNERRTELLMFVCGFGQIALDGECEINSVGFKCDSNHGYLGYAAMVQAESHVQYWAQKICRTKVEESANIEKEREARTLFDAPGQFDRMFAGYQRRHPEDTRREILHRMVEEYRRDRR